MDGLKRVLRGFLSVVMLATVTAGSHGRADDPDVAARLESLELRDCYGQPQSLKQLRDGRLLVVAFVGTECPLARLYGPKLQNLSAQFADREVRFIGVCSNVQDSLTEVVQYVNKAGIQFPMLMDPEQKLADMLQAKRTPEVVVLDAALQVRYRGRIDDQYGIGVSRLKPGQEDLLAALQNLAEGRSPTVTSTPAVGCLIGRRKIKAPQGEITWSKHIAPIVNARCLECHRENQVAPFPLASFADTVGWEAMMAEVISEDRMPPWNANPAVGHFRNDVRLTPEEKQLFLTWIQNGCPEGDAADLPTPPVFASGWRMPEPDMVIHVRDEPFQVPATGVVEYQYFQVDPGFTEDKYVMAAEARPGNPGVVHHIIAFLQVPGQKQVSLGRMLIGYAPGTSPLIFPRESAMRVPAGSKILFEMHYTPNGSPQTDRSYIGLKFVSPSEVRNEVVGIEALNEKLRIPANDNNHQVTAQRRLREDLTLLSLTPHMHLRGKSFRYDVTWPDGSTEALLDVPKYDFNWQLRYEFAEPRKIPKGAVITCTATFDNSSGNPNNPDPTKVVTWGQQSWEEMMIGFVTAVKPLPAGSEEKPE